MIKWSEIDSVFLDMDGTLLDLHFDTYFWSEHLPQRYAEQSGLPLEAAKERLAPLFLRLEGTIDWYCLDYWSRELALDVALLKREVEHLIAVHPHVIDFLDAVRAMRKRLVLVTNAHMKSLELKLARTDIGVRFDRVICSHELGRRPKESQGFWEQLQREESFLPDRTLLVDDSLAVLRAARTYGVGHLLAVARPDSRQPLRQIDEFPAIADFSAIIPSPS